LLSLRRIVDIGPRITDLGLKLLAGSLAEGRDVNALTYHGGVDAGGRFLPQLQGCKYLVRVLRERGVWRVTVTYCR
jgi:hypothetical protein